PVTPSTERIGRRLRGRVEAEVCASTSTSLKLTPAYRPLICRTKPAVRTVRVWTEEATSMMQDCFDSTDWHLFAQGADLDEYASSVMGYIHFCTENVLPKKTIKVFPNQKPWVNKSVRALIKSRDEAFRSGDRLAYSAAQRNLKKGIKEAKHSYKQRIEEHFENNNPRSMWNGIKALTDYKTNTLQASDDTSLPEVLNQFFARFDNQNRGTHHTAPPVGDQTLVLKHHQVKSTLQRVNVNKAAGPDGVCGKTLKACPSQLAEVFTNIKVKYIKPQCVRIGNHTPQGCVLSPLLFTLFTNDCTPTHSSNTIIKFADDATIVGLISDGDERAYRNEVECLDGWCKVNDLVLNTSKTKEIVVDFRRTKKSDHLPLHISGAEVERVEKVKFLGVHITNHLTRSSNTSYLCMRAQQRLYFLRKLKQAQLPQKLLVNFYHSTIESILSHCMIVWYSSCTVSERKDLHRVVKVAGRIIGTDLPSLDSVYTSRLKKKASSISRDATHPGHCLFDLLPSGKRYRAIRTKTNRLRNSFFPRAVVSTTPPQHLTD
ncbi:hypothetical protein NFI96_025832, partial [Prochilodus magdalenae]